jgi:L-histidine N-alpha-methyltransferase
MLDEVRWGLSRDPKELSPKFFYDTRGSRLFEEITELDEYYLTRTERSLLRRWMPGWIGDLQPHALVELGAGSASKTRILLDAMRAQDAGTLFVPLDVSEEFLHDAAERLRGEYPDLTVRPEVADLTHPLEMSTELPSPSLFALLGSTLGNFDEAAAVRLLSHVRATMGSADALVLGADLRPGPGKSQAQLEAAYDDAAGVTARFNLNILRVLNREVGTDFPLDAFRHDAFYDPEEGRIEMHLVASRAVSVRVPGLGPVSVDEGESIRTEISCKYDRPTLDRILDGARLRVARWEEDDVGRYALVLARPLPLDV